MTTMNWVLIDSSYYNFYRFHAALRWYSYSQDRVKAAENVAWLDNPIFMKTYEKMWFQNIKEICKQFAVDERHIVLARDGSKVWRYKVYPEYKATRPIIADADIHAPGPVFKYTNEVFHSRLAKSAQNADFAPVIHVELAEGDDVIAISVRYLRTVQPQCRITIITGDHDLLQLSDPGIVELYQLNKVKKAYKRITVDNPRAAMLSKILAGDPSDNIPPAYKGCGKKTAARLAADPELLEETLKENGRQQFELNRQLIDFGCIPESIAKEIECQLDQLI